MKLTTKSLWAAGWIILSACGQDPSFVDLERKESANIDTSGEGSRSADSATDDDAIDNFGEGEGGVLGDVIGEGPTAKPKPNTGSNGNPSNPPIDPDDHVIPDIPNDEIAAVKRCLGKWGSNNPFPQTITNVKRIVTVSVGGIGNPVNDTVATSEPQLVVIAAAVNVGGSPTYNLMNPNGYYCMIANVNVNTDLNINLHCNARLADSLVNVSVGSTMTGNAARIGVHVNSKVTINTSRPNGDECVR